MLPYKIKTIYIRFVARFRESLKIKAAAIGRKMRADKSAKTDSKDTDKDTLLETGNENTAADFVELGKLHGAHNEERSHERKSENANHIDTSRPHQSRFKKATKWSHKLLKKSRLGRKGLNEKLYNYCYAISFLNVNGLYTSNCRPE